MPTALTDPAADAAALLRRLGFAILMIVVPVAALFARRGVVVLAPLGIILLVIASVLDRMTRPAGATLRRIMTSGVGLSAGLVVLWCGLSLLWTPFLAEASERLFNIIGIVALTIAGTLALPDRMRSANLYLLPVGVAAAALAGIVAIGLQMGEPMDEDGQNLERGLIVLALMLWPALAWLVSRGRRLEGGVLAALVAIGALLAPHPMPLQGLLIGAVAFGLTSLRPALGVKATSWTMAGLLLLAPLIPFVLPPLLRVFLQNGTDVLASLEVWRIIILDEPIRLVTGHGFETALRDRLLGRLPDQTPSTLLFQSWYELGLVGVVAGAVALADGSARAGRDYPPLVPGMMASFASAYGFACLGIIGTAQIWWLTAVAVVVLLFAAVERGQFRTTRPKAFIRGSR
jgi:hypothetical protein